VNIAHRIVNIAAEHSILNLGCEQYSKSDISAHRLCECYHRAFHLERRLVERHLMMQRLGYGGRAACVLVVGAG
jgi:hypothetical protein